MRVLRFTILLLLSLIGLHSSMAQAERPYTGLDIVFLVDQSNSMSGTPPARSATDPDGLRFQALQYALTTLDDYRAAVPPGTTFRMAVVYFGDNPKTVVDWTTIGDSPVWADIKNGLSRTLSASSSESTGLVNTNFLDAFDMARELFARLPAPSSGGQHLQVMVVLTDGAPCAPDRTEWDDKTCTNERDKANHMNALEELVQDNFSRSNLQIHLIAIDQTNSFYPLYRNNWERITGSAARAVQIDGTDDIGPNFLKILSELTRRLRAGEDSGSIIGQQVDFPDGTKIASVGVPPYYQSMRLTVFRPSTSSGIRLTDPTGTLVTTATAGVTVTSDLGDIEIWTVINPTPGMWSIETTADTALLDIFLDLIRVETNFNFSPSGVVAPFSEILLQFDVFGANGLPLRTYPDPRFTLNVTANLALPDGTAKQVPMNLTTPGSYTAIYPVESAGAYAISINATSQDLNGAPTTIAQLPNAGNFTVSEARFDVTGFPPTTGLLVGDAVSLVAQFTTPDGQTIPADGLVVTAQISDQAGNLILQSDLVRRDDGSFSDTLSIDTEGRYRITVQAKRADELLYQKVSETFPVAPADLILLQFVPQIASYTHQATVGYPPQDNPFTLSVQARRDADNQPFDLEALANGQLALFLTITPKTSEVTPPTDIELRPVAGSTGLYQAVFPKLDPAEYDIQVQANERLLAPTNLRFYRPTRILETSLQVNADPSVMVINTIIVVTIISLVVATIAYILMRIRRSKFPASGKLEILEEDYETGMANTVLKTISLNGYKSNYIVLSGKNLPRKLNIKQMVIRAGTPSHGQRKMVDITITYTDGTPMINFQLTPNGEYQLFATDKRRVWIEKDMASYDGGFY